MWCLIIIPIIRQCSNFIKLIIIPLQFGIQRRITLKEEILTNLPRGWYSKSRPPAKPKVLIHFSFFVYASDAAGESTSSGQSRTAGM